MVLRHSNGAKDETQCNSSLQHLDCSGTHKAFLILKRSTVLLLLQYGRTEGEAKTIDLIQALTFILI